MVTWCMNNLMRLAVRRINTSGQASQPDRTFYEFTSCREERHYQVLARIFIHYNIEINIWISRDDVDILNSRRDRKLIGGCFGNMESDGSWLMGDSHVAIIVRCGMYSLSITFRNEVALTIFCSTIWWRCWSSMCHSCICSAPLLVLWNSHRKSTNM